MGDQDRTMTYGDGTEVQEIVQEIVQDSGYSYRLVEGELEVWTDGPYGEPFFCFVVRIPNVASVVDRLGAV
jgi:hypothetical protein